MNAETGKVIKLTIMYILNRVDAPISNSQITNYMLENDFTDYFTIQQLLGELLDDGFIWSKAVRNRTFYSLSDSGKESFKALSSELSQKIRDDADEYIRKNAMKIREESDVGSTYMETSLGTYNVNLYIDEAGERIFEIGMIVGDKGKAERMCASWARKSEELYPLVMEKLLVNKKA
ncbi:MAG: DUF4364 family protein [Lachnospiraceae bacterium]|nr:DUF4364 family protein [Lachnospiraceae bacterium]